MPVLLALDAELVLVGPAGERTLPYARFHTGYRKTALERGELIARIRIPLPPSDAFQGLRKLGTRRAQAISKVVVAIVAERAAGRFGAVRVGAGSVAPVPLRLGRTEALLRGAKIDERAAARAAACAREEVKPIDDVRSSAAYRAWALGRMVEALVLQAAG